MATTAPTASGSGGDPDLDKIVESTVPVELNHILTVPLAYLDKSPLPLQWSHNFKTMSDTYYQVAYTNNTKSESLQQSSRHATKLSLQVTSNTTSLSPPAISTTFASSTRQTVRTARSRSR